MSERKVTPVEIQQTETQQETRQETHTEITLEQMLEARERRVERQNALLRRCPGTLICFTLNIPGPRKTFPLADWAFEEGKRRIEAQLSDNGIAASERSSYIDPTGYEAYYCVERTQAGAERVKALMCLLEDRDPLGRIFDIDVLREDGEKIARTELSMPGRQCLICGSPAPVCARSRAHSVEELTTKISSIIQEAQAMSVKETETASVQEPQTAFDKEAQTASGKETHMAFVQEPHVASEEQR